VIAWGRSVSDANYPKVLTRSFRFFASIFFASHNPAAMGGFCGKNLGQPEIIGRKGEGQGHAFS